MAPENSRTTTAPAGLILTRSDDGRTIATRDGVSRTVHVTTCFPWSAPGTYLSLRDDDGHEVALVPAPDDLEEASRVVLMQALRDAAFAFAVTHVAQVKKEFEIRHWDVTCVEGRRVFQTHVDDWPRGLPPNALLITDVAGDVYYIDDWTQLDRHSQKQLAMFVD